METIYFAHTRELRKNLPKLQQKLQVAITLKGRNAIIEGESLHEYEAAIILDAMSFGFSAETALTLLDENMLFRKVPIKPHTRRKDLEDVRGRVIGKQGKTRRTVEQISGCSLKIKDNEVGIIGPAEDIEDAIVAVINIIKGSKQANVYNYLERSNTRKKQFSTDLGLKNKKEKGEDNEER